MSKFTLSHSGYAFDAWVSECASGECKITARTDTEAIQVARSNLKLIRDECDGCGGYDVLDFELRDEAGKVLRSGTVTKFLESKS